MQLGFAIALEIGSVMMENRIPNRKNAPANKAVMIILIVNQNNVLNDGRVDA